VPPVVTALLAAACLALAVLRAYLLVLLPP
jgi:hypothetical protein